MMKKFTLAATIAVTCAAFVASAQTPPTPPTGGDPQQNRTQPPQTSQPAQKPPAAAQAAGATLSGCVYLEADVPGRTPNVAERAGVMEDYILVDAKPAGQQSADASAPPSATGTSGTAKPGAMYKLENLPDERLKALVGKRVEVTGRIDAEPTDTTDPARPQADRSPGPDQINLPEFAVASVKEVPGTCPPKPAAR